MEAQQEHTQQATAAPRKRLPRAEREQQILAVAEEVFALHGYQATSMDDIAQRVGLSKPMLYEYFGSKDGLLLACVERAKRELLDSTAAAAQRAEDPEQLMHYCLVAFFSFGEDHAQAWALLRNESSVPSAPLHSELESIRRQQTEFTAELMRTTRPDLAPERLEAFAEAIIGACERLAMWREKRPEITPEIAAEHMMALISASVTVPSA